MDHSLCSCSDLASVSRLLCQINIVCTGSHFYGLLAIPFYLPSTMFALQRGGNEGSATVADAFDVFGFSLLALFNGYVAHVLDATSKHAWVPVFSWMLRGSLAAMISLFGAIWFECKKG